MHLVPNPSSPGSPDYMTDSEKMLLMLISVVAALGLAALYLLLKVLWRIVAELEKRNRSL